MIAILISISILTAALFLFFIVIQGFFKLVEKLINGVFTNHCLPHCNALDHTPSMAPTLTLVTTHPKMRRGKYGRENEREIFDSKYPDSRVYTTLNHCVIL